MSGLSHLGEPLCTAAQVRALDRAAIETGGIPGGVLMARAGRACFELLQQEWPAARTIEVVCGTGNNGGDGFVVARLARERGWEVRLRVVGELARIGGDARVMLDEALAAGLAVEAFDEGLAAAGDVLIDALLGTGLAAEVRPEQARAIRWINASGLPVLAVDVPSGLCSDTGSVLGAAVCADHTISFIARKRGLFTAVAPEYTGRRHFHALGVPPAILAAVPPAARLLRFADLAAVLPARGRAAHKGRFGHVLVIGGNRGMAGAAALAAMAAARSGAGLVSAAVRSGNEAAVLSRCPEIMVRGVAFVAELEALLARASVLVIGPGLGRDAWSGQMLTAALNAGKPVVIDADALNALADGSIDLRGANPAQWVLTPHPGEAARLLGTDVAGIGADRFGALERLLALYPGTVVLKGAGSLVGDVASGLPTGVCAEGNPGMASGGMGDILSGVLGALLAQGLAPGIAARLAVCAHACAADLVAARDGERGMLASDLLPDLRRLLNGRAPS